MLYYIVYFKFLIYKKLQNPTIKHIKVKINFHILKIIISCNLKFHILIIIKLFYIINNKFIIMIINEVKNFINDLYKFFCFNLNIRY